MSAMQLVIYSVGLMLLAGSAAVADRPMPPLSAKAEKLLEGRTAGKPVNCLYPHMLNSTTIVDKTAIIYKVSNKLWYVNRPDGGSCAALEPHRVLVSYLTIDQLCNLDIVRVVDNEGTPVDYGSCGLGQFVPYRK